MEYCTLKGFLVVLLIQHCKSEDPSTSIQSSTAVAHQDGQNLPQEPELPPAEVVPVVSHPSLKEVQQAVQEASEQVEGRGAEEVLKELLERVVEAALVQAEAGSEAKVDAVQEAVEEDSLGTESKESEADAEVLEEAAENENMGVMVEDTGVEEKQDVAEVDAFEDVDEEGEGVDEVEGETAAGSVEKTTAAVETGVREAEGVEVIDESLVTEFSEEVVAGAVAALEETGGDFALEEAGEEDSKEQVLLSEEKGAAETEIQEVEESPAVVEVAVIGQPDQETVEESEPRLGEADVKQIGHDGAREEALGEETQVNETEGEEMVVPSDNYEIEATQSVIGEPVEEKEENIVKDPEGPEVEDGYLLEGGTAEEEKAEGTDVEEVTGDEIEGETVIKEESVALAHEEGVQKAEEEEQIALETSHGGEREDEEVPVISGPGPEDDAEAPMEQSPENQAPTPNPSLSEMETGENTADDEKSNQGNEIITTTDDLLPQEPAVAQPTLDNLVDGAPGEQPEAQGEEPGEANELVEDTAGTTETNELGLEAWKIGAISAAVFLVVETVVIIIYILKCRNKNSTSALQRACEEGCVEPEAATGGDCSDETLPAGNGDTQQIAALDPSDVAVTLATTKEKQGDEHAIAMSDLPPSSTEESASTGPGPDSSQDLRTSIL